MGVKELHNKINMNITSVYYKFMTCSVFNNCPSMCFIVWVILHCEKNWFIYWTSLFCYVLYLHYECYVRVVATSSLWIGFKLLYICLPFELNWKDSELSFMLERSVNIGLPHRISTRWITFVRGYRRLVRFVARRVCG